MVSAVRHMSVSVCAGSTSETAMCHCASSIRSASAAASSANFDALYAPTIGIASLPFTLEMNTILPRDSAAGQDRTGHGKLADHVDLQLLSPVLSADGLDGAADRDACVVHDAVEPHGQGGDESGDVFVVGHVQDHRGYPPRVGRRDGHASASVRTPAMTSHSRPARCSVIDRPIPRAAPVMSTDGMRSRLAVGVMTAVGLKPGRQVQRRDRRHLGDQPLPVSQLHVQAVGQIPQ